jgi:di/tripeptidase
VIHNMTAGDPPTVVYFTVIEEISTDGTFELYHSRPYAKLKTARMRLTTLLNEDSRARAGWVAEYDLANGRMLEW